MTNKSTITFHGGAGMVTGANFLFDTGGKKILVDCGLAHGKRYRGSEDERFSYDPKEIDVLFVTHAHADHIGKIPKLVRDGFCGTIYSTSATKDLSAVMFDDAFKILTREAKKFHYPPLYTDEDIKKTFPLWKTIDYHESLEIGDGISVKFFDAGHILGSSMIEFVRGEKKIVFTGDLGNSPAPLLPDTERIIGTHYFVMESVYGDRNHETRRERTKKLAQALSENFQCSGTLLIPAFALQRAQILVYEINNLVESGEIPKMPIYFDAPLAMRVTDIFYKYQELFNENIKKAISRGDDIFDFPKFVVVQDAKRSFAIDKEPGPKVIIASSGMSIGGRVRLHERRLLENKNNTILFVGYQAFGTLGRAIQEGKSEVHIDGKLVHVHARVETIRGYSGHKDSDHLVDFVSDSVNTLKKIFVVMGEPQAAEFLADKIGKNHSVIATTPKAGDREEIDF